jgi:hypothetical protein
MNDRDMHEFFRRNEERMNKPLADDEHDDVQDASFDNFVTARSGKSFGFYIKEDFFDPKTKTHNWDAVVWLPRSMIEDGRISVRRIVENKGTQLERTTGFVVTMPAWLAAEKGVI